MICLDYVIKEKWVLFVMVLVKVSEFRFGKMILPRVDHTGSQKSTMCTNTKTWNGSPGHYMPASRIS